jgi:photosystem II stability/assembly factor-like uncharacterized protein
MRIVFYLCIAALSISTADAQWEQMKGIEKSYIFSLGASEHIIYAGTRGDGIFRSVDGGSNWLSVLYDQVLAQETISCLAAMDSFVFAGAMDGIRRSTNNGISWSQNEGGFPETNIYSIAHIGNNIYAATDRGLFHSTNNGDEWHTAPNTLPVFNSNFILTYDNSLYSFGNTEGVYRSSDSGTTWNRIDSGFQTSSNILAVNGGSLFAGGETGLYGSNDSGRTWRYLQDGTILSFASAANHTFAGGSILSVTNDYGNTWNDLDTVGLPNDSRNALLVFGNYLFLGTYTRGVWRRPLTELSVKNDNLSEQLLDPSYPNPFSIITTINFTLPKTSTVSITILDILGNTVFAEQPTTMSDGKHSIQWNAGSSPEGTYICGLTVNGKTEIRKLVVLK